MPSFQQPDRSVTRRAATKFTAFPTLDKASLGSTFKRVDDHLGVEVEDRWDTGVVLTHVAGSVCAQQPAQVLNSAESQLAAVTCTLQNSLNTVAMWNYIFSFSLPSKLAPQIGWIISPLITCLPKHFRHSQLIPSCAVWYLFDLNADRGRPPYTALQSIYLLENHIILVCIRCMRIFIGQCKYTHT